VPLSDHNDTRIVKAIDPVPVPVKIPGYAAFPGYIKISLHK
jgi:hypothetical protein